MYRQTADKQAELLKCPRLYYDLVHGSGRAVATMLLHFSAYSTMFLALICQVLSNVRWILKKFQAILRISLSSIRWFQWKEFRFEFSNSDFHEKCRITTAWETKNQWWGTLVILLKLKSQLPSRLLEHYTLADPLNSIGILVQGSNERKTPFLVWPLQTKTLTRSWRKFGLWTCKDVDWCKHARQCHSVVGSRASTITTGVVFTLPSGRSQLSQDQWFGLFTFSLSL